MSGLEQASAIGPTAGPAAEVSIAEVQPIVEQLLTSYPPQDVEQGSFLRAQYDAGLAWVHFPVGLGGVGADRRLQAHVDERLREAGAPQRPRDEMLGYRMGGPTVMGHGTLDQKQHFLPRIFTRQDRWCQLFSEPGSGSDLASVATRARRDGTGWVVSGQKVWSSYAVGATVGMLLARTDPDAPKHRGLTFFAIDMTDPGIDVRPLRQLTGEREFNEVFLTDVRVDDSARIGAEGNGWRIAQTTLASERGMYGSRGFGAAARGTAIGEALTLWRGRTSQDEDEALRLRIVQLWIDSRVLAWTNDRVAGAEAVPPPVAKIEFARVQQRGFELCLDLMGEEILLGTNAPDGGPLFDADDVRHHFLRSRANSIEGGSSEIMHNVIARRVLGLPSDDTNKRDIPWSQLARN